MVRYFRSNVYRGSATFLRCALALAMLLGGVACSRQVTGPEPIGPEPTEAVEAPDEPNEENITVTFASQEYDRSLYEPLMEKFMAENPGIRIQFVALPEITTQDEAEAINWLRTMATTADTGLTWGGSLDPNMSTYFRDLGPLVDANPAFDTDDFWPNALDACADGEGRLLGVPLKMNVNGVYYDQEAFDAAGLTYPAPGWTWEDFSNAAAALAGQVGGKTRYGFADQTYIYGSILAPIVGAHLEETGGKIDAGALLSDLQWYLDLAEREAILPLHEPEDWNADWAKRVAIFQSEARPAMWVGSLAETMPGNDQIYNQDDPFSGLAFRTDGFAPFPIDADDREAGTSPVYPTCISMSAGATQPRAAWAWMDFLTRQSLVRDENQSWERLQAPARRSVSDQMDYFSVLPEEARPSVRFALEHAWFGSLYPETFASAQPAITKTIQEGMSFAEAVEAAQGELQNGPQPTPDTAEVVVATPPAPPPEDATVINYFYNAWEPRDRENFKAIVENFNAEHPDLYVKPSYDIMNPPTTGDLMDWISEQYDCFSWYPSFNSNQPPRGVISLSSLVDAEDPEFIQDFVPEQLDALRFEGELYGLPAASQPKMIAYNADLLAKRGLEPPALDWTFDDFIELLTAAASTSEDDQSYGFLIDPWENFLFIGRAAEWADLTKDPPEANFNSPDMVSAMAWMTELIDSGALLVQRDDSIESWTMVEQAFREGQVAFWVAQAGQQEGWWFQGAEPDYEIGVAPLPAIDELSASELVYWDTPQSQFISTQAQDPQACWKWIKFLSEQLEAFSGVPARRSLIASPAWIAAVGEDTAEAYRYALEQTQKPDEAIQMSPIGWPFYTWRSQAIEEILKGEDIEKALSKAQNIASDYLACMGAVEPSALDDEQLQKEVNRCARQVDPEGYWPEP